MKIFLAPMEGLTDFYMRDVLTRMGRYDACVTEFIRVTDRLHPARVFYNACPELRTQGKTAVGTPVHIQLLGSEPVALAENAARAARLGAPSIDLNFGCPAKTVNKHRGGAVLLDEPETVHAIVSAVRRAVPASTPVTAKMRLGMRDHSRMLENALAIEAAGAAALVVHARTREDGYRPPAHWEAIAQIRAAVKLPVMANGEIWTVADAQRCRHMAQCENLMLGRGAITRPDLVNAILGRPAPLSWAEMVKAQLDFLAHMEVAGRDARSRAEENSVQAPPRWTECGTVGRYKQWLGLLIRGFPEAAPVFAQVKSLRTLLEVRAVLRASARSGQEDAARSG